MLCWKLNHLRKCHKGSWKLWTGRTNEKRKHAKSLHGSCYMGDLTIMPTDRSVTSDITWLLLFSSDGNPYWNCKLFFASLFVVFFFLNTEFFTRNWVFNRFGAYQTEGDVTIPRYVHGFIFIDHWLFVHTCNPWKFFATLNVIFTRNSIFSHCRGVKGRKCMASSIYFSIQICCWWLTKN